ncbi:hypothetical protein EDF46_1970 [Frondihabitans sp. PhB188]|uniref:hypothetical protein n=1 Tax=Frondihabitans sp. PhB188 TaxID=2485200 RepID=UPI000F47485C|nr:hypothetical protein [Frondihabitans sp. PhB188]ROQ38338.1 hypothetical protein EDF46_1970 [Frondihabitans sp. PhB188]
MNWFNSAIDWISSADGTRVITTTVLPFVAIVVAGIVAALIGRGMSKRILDVREREAKAATVTSLVAAARRSVDWSTLGTDERSHATLLADEAGIRLRLLPVSGAGLAAAWSEHEIASIRSNSATFSFQSQQTFADVRDRLVEWQAKPSRAKRLFQGDIERWKAEEPEAAPIAAAGPSAEASGLSAEASGLSAEASARRTDLPSFAAPAAAPNLAATPTEAAAPNPAATPTPAPTPGSADATSAAPVSAETATVSATTASTSSAASASPVAADEPADHTDTAEVERLREPAYSSPVSAHDVRRRTSPEAAEQPAS